MGSVSKPRSSFWELSNIFFTIITLSLMVPTSPRYRALRCAPSYANLYLGEWELAISGDESLTPFMEHVLMWMRYIDNVFLVWDGSPELLQDFMTELNHNEFNLNFTMTHDSSNITFLDVTIHKDEDGRLTSSLYRKTTAGNSIFPSSCTCKLHPFQPIPQD